MKPVSQHMSVVYLFLFSFSIMINREHSCCLLLFKGCFKKAGEEKYFLLTIRKDSEKWSFRELQCTRKKKSSTAKSPAKCPLGAASNRNIIRSFSSRCWKQNAVLPTCYLPLWKHDYFASRELKKKYPLPRKKKMFRLTCAAPDAIGPDYLEYINFNRYTVP